MRTDRPHGEPQRSGDLLIRVAERDQPQHVGFTGGELREPAVLGNGTGRERRTQRRVQVGATGRDALDGLDQLYRCCLLEHVGGRASGQGGARRSGAPPW